MTGDFRDWVPPADGCAVTIGVYDGVHLGHQHVLSRLRARADVQGGLPVTVATFDRHPLSVVAPERTPPLITTTRQKLELFERLGVDATALLTFDETLRSMGHDEFAEKVVGGALGASVVVVGSDFRFGRDREGDVAVLRRLGGQLGFDVEEVELVGSDGPISSTAIRRAISKGDLSVARSLLGRRYQLWGTVVAGAGRGQEVGYPTANLEIDGSLVIPGYGVYAVMATIDDHDHEGVVNVGVRPTFGEEREVVEVHVLDFDRDLYGQEVRLTFVSRLRGERRFEGIEELRAQITRDVATAAEILSRAE